MVSSQDAINRIQDLLTEGTLTGESQAYKQALAYGAEYRGLQTCSKSSLASPGWEGYAVRATEESDLVTRKT